MLSGAAMPGWRFVRGGLTVSLFAGPVVQDYRLTPYDPGSRLHGLYVGANSQPTFGISRLRISWPPSTARSPRSARPDICAAALGYRVFDAMFLGPETAMLWCAEFQQLEVGAHLTGLHFDAMEWSAAGGWSMDSDRRTGPYLRLGVSAKY